MFPYTYRGKQFYSCKRYDVENIDNWNPFQNTANKDVYVCPTNVSHSSSKENKQLGDNEPVYFYDYEICSPFCPTEPDICEDCVFPFNFDGHTYKECNKDNSGSDLTILPIAYSFLSNGWCSTNVGHNHTYLEGLWGHCSKECTKNIDKSFIIGTRESTGRFKVCEYLL